MDTPLSLVFQEICRECGCHESFSQPALEILNQNFFYKLSDIKNINFDIWRALNLPLNLFYILQEKIKLIESNQLKINPFIDTFQNVKPDVKLEQRSQIIPKSEVVSKSNVISEKTISQNIQNVPKSQTPQSGMITSTQPEPEQLLKQDIYQILDNLLVELKDKEKIKEVFKKLHTIIMNIISSPAEEKFRKLNTESKFYQSISAYKYFLKFLDFIQFNKISNNYIEYKGDENFIIKVGEIVNQFLLDRKIAESSFNPYATSIIGTNINSGQMKSLVEPPDFDELIKAEKERREAIIKCSKEVNREAKIFIIQPGENVSAILENLYEEDKKNISKIEEQDFYKYAMNIIKSNTDKFVVKRRTEFENLVSKPIYTQATIRIKFPNENILQANFAMMETVGDVYKFVRENLEDPSLEFSLFTPYPRRVYNDQKATVYSQSLAPNTLLYISFPNVDARNVEFPFLKQQSIEKWRSEFKH